MLMIAGADWGRGVSIYLIYALPYLSTALSGVLIACLAPGGRPSAPPCGSVADALERPAFGGIVPAILTIPAADVLFQCDSDRRAARLRWSRTLVVHRCAGAGSGAVALGQHKKIKNAVRNNAPEGLLRGIVCPVKNFLAFPLTNPQTVLLY